MNPNNNSLIDIDLIEKKYQSYDPLKQEILQIIALHHSKRELADSLLEGTDISAKITADELLKLII